MKARLATDGYVDAYAAYSALNDPKPLLIISNIEVDDSGVTGNNNGQVDPGENIELKITLSNIGETLDSVNVVLDSETLGIEAFGIDSTTNFPDFDEADFQYGRYVFTFPVNFANFYQSQNVSFTLYLTSYFDSNSRKIETVRNFTIDTGSLALGTQINNVIRRNNDNQDEIHFYYVEITEAQDTLNIDLSLDDLSSNIELLVKLGSFPQFEYTRLKKPDGIDVDIYRGEDDNQGTKQVVIENPQPGTYYIAVIVDRKIKKPNINYQLSANVTEKNQPSTMGGCSLVPQNQFDPVLYLLIIVSLYFIIFKRRKNIIYV